MRERLRRLFEPILQDAWMYPALIAAGTLLPGALGLYEEWSWMWNTLQVLLVFSFTVGLPMNLCYRHGWDRIVGDRVPPFTARGIGFHLVVIPFWIWAGGGLGAAILVSLRSEFPFEEFRVRGALFGVALLTAAIAVSTAIDRYRGRVRDLELRELRARQESTAAQLQAIQARIQPHFLFNCLNTVAGLIQESPALAEEAVERLADLFRYTLQSSKRRTVALEEEIQAVRGFLALEGLRYGDRVKAALHVAPGLEAAVVPPLVLQPIVENAILHGIAPRREGGRLEVRVESESDGRLAVEVEDDGPGPGASSHRGTRTALTDLRRRLGILYAGQAGVEEGRGALGGYQIRITLPAGGPEPIRVEEPP